MNFECQCSKNEIECVQNGVSVYFKCQKCGRGRDYFETDVQIAFSKHKTDFKYPSTFEQVRKKELRN